MSVKLHVDAHELAALISQSVREVLDAQGLTVWRVHGSGHADQLAGGELEALLYEIGRNTAGCAAAIDTHADDTCPLRTDTDEAQETK